MEERDLETILAWRNRDEARVWFKSSDKIAFEAHLSWYKRYLQKEDDFFFLIEANGRPVGQCGIYDIDHYAGSAEIGRFLVAPDMGGRGYIKRSCAELVRFGIDVLKLPNLFLEVMERNRKAIELYTRCGFAEESRSNGLIRMNFNQEPAR
ncbi:GNAT family N-acetyltransferase [Mesorhizobium sp. B1-1-5]|nr:GNAT family N-acetyltransferase [Mesorhizobium sp. B1-1-5]